MNQQAQQIVTVVIFGLVVGWLASQIVGGGGLFTYIIWGILGSALAGWAVPALGIRVNLGHPLVTNIVMSTLGAVVVVAVARVIF